MVEVPDNGLFVGRSLCMAPEVAQPQSFSNYDECRVRAPGHLDNLRLACRPRAGPAAHPHWESGALMGRACNQVWRIVDYKSRGVR